MANILEIKEKNKKNIFDVIYQERQISKSEIAKRLNLSMPTVTENLSELFDRNLIRFNGTFHSTGGRKARIIEFDATVKYAIGIDITENHISGALINLYGEVLYSVRLRFRFQDKDSYYSELKQLVEHIVAENHLEPDRILGVGFSVPAIVKDDRRTITFFPLIEPLMTIYDDLMPYMDYPYGIFNDANCGGYAELWHAKKVENMIYLSLSNTVGGAILINNSVYYGKNCHSGEIGHMTLKLDGKPCHCGKRGCVDIYCRAKNLSDLTEGNLKKFFELVEAGDERCTRTWDEYLDYLAVMVNNVNNMMDCDIMIGGYVGGYMDKYIEDLRRRVVKRSTFQTDGTFIKTCYFKYESSAVGAALYFVNKFISEV